MTVKQSKENKTWYARVSYKADGKYKTKSKYEFQTKKEAQIWENSIKVQLDSGIDIGIDPLFIDFFLNWFKTYKEQKVADATKVNFMATYSKIKEYFKETKIKKISRYSYQSFLNHYGKLLAKTTMQKINKHIRACVQDAIQNGVLQKDFTYKAEITGLDSKSKDMKYLSEKDSKSLIASLKEDCDDTMTTRRMAMLALATGMRFSEISGLTYSNLNFKSNTISIEHTWDSKNRTFKKTKTDGSNRSIKVEPLIMADLQSFVTKQKERQLSRQIRNPRQLVFSQFDGTPPTNNAANKTLMHACTRAKIQKITFHALRHTHVSILIYRGMDIPSIAKRIGHSSPSTTMEVYSHVIQELQHKSDIVSDLAIAELFSL